MAEGGDGNEENPFSFQKFVKKRSSPGSASSGDAEDEDDPFEIPDLRPDSSERNRARGLVVTDGMCSCHKQPRTVISMQSCQVTLDISGSPIDPSVALTEIAGVSLTGMQWLNTRVLVVFALESPKSCAKPSISLFP